MAVGVDGAPARFGFVGFLGLKAAPMPLNASEGITAGMNEAGLTCDKQSLKPQTAFPAPTGSAADLDAALLCRWALEACADVPSVEAALARVNVVEARHDPEFRDGHYVFRDRDGRSLVAEFVAGEARLCAAPASGGWTRGLRRGGR